jgi:hypothetical protein
MNVKKMFEPINEIYNCDNEIDTCVYNLFKLKTEFYNIEQKLTEINTQIQIHKYTKSQKVIQILSQTLIQELEKKKYYIRIQYLKELKKKLELKLQKNNFKYNMITTSDLNLDHEIILVPAIYASKYIQIYH